MGKTSALKWENPQPEDREQDDPEGRSEEPFRVKPHSFGFDPRVDLNKLNRLLDELEALETAEKLAK
jgi:hypothetical protein